MADNILQKRALLHLHGLEPPLALSGKRQVAVDGLQAEVHGLRLAVLYEVCFVQ